MTDLRKAAEQAATDLEELIHWHGVRDSDDKLMPAHNQTPEIKSAIESLDALRQALSQPEQRPVGTYEGVMETMLSLRKGTLEQQQIYTHMKDKLLYTAPPKREWVGLSEEEIDALLWKLSVGAVDEDIRTIEAKLKEKNT